ncbi:DUF1080 domain-containing protein [Luteolibacter sp. SL250]|uniref:family 16 glycoside hydrolase n=1 Tax=Luteolibacter sp. SL250 TaxID=2995170 RepID=UPI00226DF94E|nr:family 16 glycoside hydrolase [Luteolibacter sp. SL250]WAC19322.1 DUF1080 domain-containing protein [Luteolibacter sp. SL250]
MAILVAALLSTAGGAETWRRNDPDRPQPPIVAPGPEVAPVAAPPEAIKLFDGADLSHWTAKLSRGPDKGKVVPPQWKISGGVMEAVPNGGTIICKERFGDCHLHVEWATPVKIDGTGQKRGNSGVLIQGLCEIQILDSFGNTTYPDGQAGAVYGKYPPLVNACRKPGEWQTFDITLQTARLDAAGKILQPARVTVIHNGILIQDAVAIPDNVRQVFTFALQDHLNPVRFRNVWMRKFDDATASPAVEAAAPFRKNAPEPACSSVVPHGHPFVPPSTGTDRGEHLMAALNCASCHPAGAALENRLPGKKAPLLGPEGLRLSPRFITDYLLDPQREKPGTTMPDMLHGMDPAGKQDAAEALTHFLMSVSREDTAATPGDETRIARGRSLYHQTGCVACHAPVDAPQGSGIPLEEVRTLATDSVPLGPLEKKYSVAQLSEFLLKPGKFRPERRMPGMKLTAVEATDISMYLLRGQVESATRVMKKEEGIRTPGLRYELFDGLFKDCGPSLEKAAPVASGSIGGIEIAQWAQEGHPFAVRFSGSFEVPVDGAYTFYTRSTDGSRLWIDGTQVVENDGRHKLTEKSGVAHLKAGAHAFVLTYFQGEKTKAALTALFDGPGIRKRPIKAQNVSHLAPAMRPTGEEPFTVDAAKAGRGKELFGQLGCARCHHSPGVTGIGASAFKLTDLLEAKPEAAGGCLSATPAAGAPLYHLSADQQAAISRTLADPALLKSPLPPEKEAARVLGQLNCLACHSRDGAGGPHGLRADYVQNIGETDLGDEGRMPPHLTKVGAKLEEGWMKKVLLQGGGSRPYMATRMPQFGTSVAELSELLAVVDGGTPRTEEPTAKPAEESVKAGRDLVGTGGLGCVMCHSFGKHPSLGIPALDLAGMTGRLRPDWFRRYLVDPQSLRPGTRMPSFWPHGIAANRDILGGDTDRQLDAIWDYLSGGAAADPPPGVIQAKMEVVAEGEPVIYRNFIEDAGPRAMGIGYPEKVNLAFDAEQLRLALLWHGSFIDAGRHRTGRGGGFEAPMGTAVLKLPSGPAYAVLDTPTTAWPATAKEGDAAFHGYAYDGKRRPTLRYSWNDVTVEDHFAPVAEQTASGFLRTIRLPAGAPLAKSWFRVATGRIEDEGGGTWRVDGKLRLTLSGDVRPVARGSGGKAELIVPLDGVSTFTVKYTW